jgi:hypothetical protein
VEVFYPASTRGFMCSDLERTWKERLWANFKFILNVFLQERERKHILNSRPSKYEKKKNATRYSKHYFIDWVIRNSYSALLANEFYPVTFAERRSKVISNWNVFPVAAN